MQEGLDKVNREDFLSEELVKGFQYFFFRMHSLEMIRRSVNLLREYDPKNEWISGIPDDGILGDVEARVLAERVCHRVGGVPETGVRIFEWFYVIISRELKRFGVWDDKAREKGNKLRYSSEDSDDVPF